MNDSDERPLVSGSTSNSIPHDDEEELIPTGTPARTARRESSEDDGESYSGDSDQEQLAMSTSTRERDRKSRLVGQILARWWYVMDPWPPADFNYQAELVKRQLKQLTFDMWEEADDVDANNFKKVYEITHFPGMFRDPSGAVIDLRPDEGKPCYKNLMQKSEAELTQMLHTALKNQISETPDSPYQITDSALMEKLKQDLERMFGM